MVHEKILVVDDDKDIVELISFTLKQAGYSVLEASNGNEAMNFIHRETPDLVILDLMLPEGNGFEICRLLRIDERYKNIPVVILTAKTNKDDRMIGRIMNVEEYIIKPFDPNNFIVRIKKVLENSRRI